MKSTTGSENSVKKVVKKVAFIVKGIEAQEVSVTGDFSGWSQEGLRLTKEGDGDWRTTLELEPGEHQYRLRVDGEWRNHESAEKHVPNPFGSQNCVLEVPQKL